MDAGDDLAQPAPAFPTIELIPAVTPDELVDCWRWMYFHAPSVRQAKKTRTALAKQYYFVIIATSAFFTWLYYTANSVNPPNGVIVSVGILVLVTWWMALLQRHKPGRNEAWYVSRWEPQAEKQAHLQWRGWRMSVGPQGVQYENEFGLFVYRWRGVCDVREFGLCAIITLAGMRYVYIPLRLLGPVESRSDLLAAYRQAMESNQGGEQHFVRHYLAERDVPCPKCKYNLRGVQRAACPECGGVLDMTTLPAAFAAP